MTLFLKTAVGTAAIVVSMGLASAGFFAPTAGATTLKASHQWNTSDVRHKMMQIIADDVAKANVDLKIKIYPSKSLYKPKEQWTPLTRGQLDLTAFPLAYAAGQHPEFDATLMPGLVKNHEHARRLNNSKFMADIKKIINKSGVMVIADTWLAGGFASRKQCIRGPETMKGLVTRAAGKAFEQMLVGAGASIASMPSSEIYTAMQTGVLDAANTSSGSFVSYRIYEQAKCMTAPGDQALWFMYEPILMSTKSFNKLNKAQQKAILAAGKKAEAFFFDAAKGLDDKMVKVFKKAGVKVITMTKAEADAWRAIAKKTSYAEFEKKVPGGKKLIEEALAVQ
ncbi:TRAP transporter substrate-binding protein DctP [Varunaivibrio sulfuroxidans]|uniref:TRAP-type C4-dicarboxylate transport system substrate-binding protein n=1 Tax=Varunaivibrio sulfuroxidans TaxID=1773489 RepID=A0A4V2UNV3_9PROT|nr:TRAP transporter substrate-binding protein DctP [Varunaivibrio sulfuroxidans]TCS63401.1 TRAP-type C4-dicarboxylate transport system substrate-binding protein [Varunaivibrio sulfuroxidans]WES30453.1 TRAP transporter substrate-binding protein DctP [Varunaivibrio sulfuroxidans]